MSLRIKRNGNWEDLIHDIHLRKRDNWVYQGYYMLKDENFNGTLNGSFTVDYSSIPTQALIKGYFQVPTSIKGVPITSHRRLFMDSIVGTKYSHNVRGVRSRNSNVTTTDSMFMYYQGEEIDLSEYNTLGLNALTNMFASSERLRKVKGLNLVGVKSMNSTFSRLVYTPYLDLTDLDTSTITSMNNTFSYSNIDILDLSSFDFSSVTQAVNMFSNASIDTVYVRSAADATWIDNRVPSGTSIVIK